MVWIQWMAAPANDAATATSDVTAAAAASTPSSALRTLAATRAAVARKGGRQFHTPRLYAP